MNCCVSTHIKLASSRKTISHVILLDKNVGNTRLNPYLIRVMHFYREYTGIDMNKILISDE